MNEVETKKRAHNFQDLTGRQFGRLTVISLTRGFPGKTKWLCRCQCGAEQQFHAGDLKKGHSRSCGCLRNETAGGRTRTHGMSGSALMGIWSSMIQRCTNPARNNYQNYGGRGIKVCERWRSSFAAFHADMGDRPSPQHQIDRVDNDGDYCPENCQWATRGEQSRNRSTNRNITFNGQTKCLVDWSEVSGVSVKLLHWRLKAGWSVESALTTPVG